MIGMDGTPTRWNGLIITLCRFEWEFSCNVQMFVKSPSWQCYRSTVWTYGKPLYFIILKIISTYHSFFSHYRTYVDDQEIMHITTPSQGFWNWAHFQGHNIWGNNHNAPFDHSVSSLLFLFWKLFQGENGDSNHDYLWMYCVLMNDGV